ncbi:ABC transporter permease [Streptomyces sp. NPDC048417]|uniref:ABC transporter permease n=1 Tax=Streptomyces sp. NPDC048417 TaxID=3155387 RepID=UPI00343E1C04
MTIATDETTPSGVTPFRSGGLRWMLLDGLTIVRRNLTHLRHAPGALIATLVVPVVFIVLFGYVFGSAIAVPGGGNYREFLMPGLFVMMSMGGVMATTSAIARDSKRGIMDRFRSMPMSRATVPFGQAGADLIVGLLELLVMALCGLVVGWRAHGSVGSALAGFGLLALFRYALTWVGAFLGLIVTDEETADHILILVFPVSMISNTFVPTAGMPAWLQTIADWNPVSAAVAACRELWHNPGATAAAADTWPLRHPVTATLGWSLLLIAVFMPLSVLRHQRAGR